MRGCPFTDPKVEAIATAHGVSTAQVCLRWVLQRGAVSPRARAPTPRPRRSTPARTWRSSTLRWRRPTWPRSTPCSSRMGGAPHPPLRPSSSTHTKNARSCRTRMWMRIQPATTLRHIQVPGKCTACAHSSKCELRRYRAWLCQPLATVVTAAEKPPRLFELSIVLFAGSSGRGGEPGDDSNSSSSGCPCVASVYC